MPRLKQTKRLWEIWVHFQKTNEQTCKKASWTYLNSHICLDYNAHLQKTRICFVTARIKYKVYMIGDVYILQLPYLQKQQFTHVF